MLVFSFSPNLSSWCDAKLPLPLLQFLLHLTIFWYRFTRTISILLLSCVSHSNPQSIFLVTLHCMDERNVGQVSLFNLIVHNFFFSHGSNFVIIFLSNTGLDEIWMYMRVEDEHVFSGLGLCWTCDKIIRSSPSFKLELPCCGTWNVNSLLSLGWSNNLAWNVVVCGSMDLPLVIHQNQPCYCSSPSGRAP